MKGRRTAAMLCVLIGHALLVLALMNLTTPEARRSSADESFTTQLYFIEEDEHAETEPEPAEPTPVRRRAPVSPAAPAPAAGPVPPGQSTAITPPGFVDWPLEGKQSAA